jgi:hypothetical protein
MRPNGQLIANAIHRWQQVYASHKNSQSFAAEYEANQLRMKVIIAWRMRLRGHHVLRQQAKIHDKHILLRRMFAQWTDSLAERQQERRLRILQQRKLKTIFSGLFVEQTDRIKTHLCG